MDGFVREVEASAGGLRRAEKRTREVEDLLRALSASSAAPVVLALILRRLAYHRKHLPFNPFDRYKDPLVDVLRYESTRDYFLKLWHFGEACTLLAVLEYAALEGSTADGFLERYLSAEKGYPLRILFATEETRMVAWKAGRFLSETVVAEYLSALTFARAQLSRSRRGAVELREKLSGARGSGPQSPARRFIHEAAGEVLPLYHEPGMLDPELRKLTNETTRRIRRFGAGKDAPADSRIASLAGAEPSDSEELFRVSEAADRLEQIMQSARLTQQEREAFEASVLYGSEEASRRLGRPANQIRQEKYRALRKLRRVAGL